MAIAPRPDGSLADVAPLRPKADEDQRSSLAAVGQDILDHLDELVPSWGAAYQREVPEYAAMDRAQFDNVLDTSRVFVERFVEHLVAGAQHPSLDRGNLSSAGRRRQEIGITLDAAMHAFRIISRVGWTALADSSAAIDPSVVSELAGRWIDYVDRGATAFAEGHTTAASEHLRRVDARRQALLADLLAAEDEGAARAVGARHGMHLAEWYVPVLVATDEPIVVQDRLRPVVDRGAIIGQRADHVMVLLPRSSGASRLPSLTAIAAEGPVAHGDPARLGSSLVAEVARTESVLTAIVTLDATGIHGPDALLLHRVVREHDALENHLAERVLGPLREADGDEIFRETLRAFLDIGTVRGVADQLFVHANTVTYRLRRIREITGLDARMPRQAALLVLAIALEDTMTDREDPA